MYGILRRHWEQSGRDEQERLMLSFDKLFAREKDNALKALHELWREKQSICGNVPRAEDLEYNQFLPAPFTRYICWSDVSGGDPYNFVTREHANLTSFSNHSDRRLGEHPSRMNAKACAAEYIHCKTSRQPVYHEIDQTVGSINRHYFRLMLPVADNSGRVTKLVYAVRLVKGDTTSKEGINSLET